MTTPRNNDGIFRVLDWFLISSLSYNVVLSTLFCIYDFDFIDSLILKALRHQNEIDRQKEISGSLNDRLEKVRGFTMLTHWCYFAPGVICFVDRTRVYKWQ